MSIAAEDIVIRPSTDEDVPAMLKIYRHHTQHGLGDLGAYQEEPLVAEDLKQRRKNMRNRRLPHLVADVKGFVAGYAYAVPFRKRPAYRFAVKHSIYIHSDFMHAGIGRLLLPALIDECAQAGFWQMIGYIDSANEASLRLHESCGFMRAGVLKSIGYKFGQWTDSVIVQRALCDSDTAVPGLWPVMDPPDRLLNGPSRDRN